MPGEDAHRDPPRPLATVGALLIGPRGNALFVRTRKWRDRWGVPGGKIEFGESLRDALARETLEETGLRPRDVRWAPTQEAVRSDEFHADAHFLLLNFVARVDREEATLNEEAQEARWLRPREALAALDLNAPTRALVRHYLAHGHAGPPLAATAGAAAAGARRA